MARQEYVQRNRQWLQDKASESGVMPIDKGIYYRVVKSGGVSAVSPTRSSIVTVHYTGKTINGKVFDSSRGGMHVGDRWEIYIPAEQAYGKISQPGIPGGSTLIFDIELLSVM